MKAQSKSSNEVRSKYLFEQFLRIPSLEFDSNEFPYAHFETASSTIEATSLSIPDDLMIGKQAEQCFEHYLRTSSRYDVLASNIQVQGVSQTMGELDYLVFDNELQQHLHIELACKFYLLDSRERNFSAWIGPNRKDSLDQKLKKLQQKQFPLLFTEETATVLHNMQVNFPHIEQRHCLKAFLFEPKNRDSKNVSAKWRSSIVGEWMDLDSFEDEDPSIQYALPKKTAWLLPPDQISTWISHQELIVLIKEQHKNKKTPLVYQKSNEVLKLFFIVWWK